MRTPPTPARRYAQYFVIGGIVGIASIVLREVIEWSTGDTSPRGFALSVVVSYAVAILMSYSGHRYITFRDRDRPDRLLQSVAQFSLIAILGMASTTAISTAIRFATPVESYFGGWAGAVALTVAALVTSIATFTLNSLITFRDRRSRDA